MEREKRLSRLRRVATSCTKGSDRTSYLTRACCGPSTPTYRSPRALILSFSFSVCTRVHDGDDGGGGDGGVCHRFIPSPARALVRSNLCLSLSLLVWFVGSRLGTVITEYPPLTSGTLVVLSPPLAHLLPPKTRRGPTRAMTTDGVRPGASGTNLPSPPAAPRPPSPSLPHRPSSLLYPRRPVPALSHHRACSPFLFFSSFSIFPLLSRFIHSACPLLSHVPSSFFLSFRCRSFQTLSFSLTLFLSSSLFHLHSSLLSSSRSLTTCVLLAIQSTRKGSWARVGDVLIRRF